MRTRSRPLLLPLLLLLGFLAQSAQAEHNVALFLSANGADIEGENPRTTLDRENSIEVFSVGTAFIRPLATGSGPTLGAAQHKPLTITKPVDKATPLILKALAQNQTIERAELRFYRPTTGGGEEHYYTILLQDGRVSASTMVAEPGGEPIEMVSFVFLTITWTHEPSGVEHLDNWSSSS